MCAPGATLLTVFTKTRLIILPAFLALLAHGQTIALPDVPEAIKTPPGEKVILQAHASGSQIYTCRQTDNKVSWVLKGPEAELRDQQGAAVATGHSGDGWLSRVSSIQRIHTKGGQPPTAAECDPSKVNTETKIGYTADYYFYAPVK